MFLSGKTILLIGDSHMRYLFNYLWDFLEGPCHPAVYQRDKVTDGYFQNLCAYKRADGFQSNVRNDTLSARGGVFNTSSATTKSDLKVKLKVNLP